jgi:hypothetical protein
MQCPTQESDIRTDTGVEWSKTGIILSPLLFNPLNPELNPICHLLALLGVHHFLHVSRIRVNMIGACLIWSESGLFWSHFGLQFFFDSIMYNNCQYLSYCV